METNQPWPQQVKPNSQQPQSPQPKSEGINPMKKATVIDGKAFEELLSKPQPIADENRGMDVLFFGDTNVGKTFSAMTFPEPIFVIDTEKRADKTKKYHYPGRDIRIFDPVVIKQDYVDDEDAIDYPSSIDNITNFVVALNRKIQAGEIKEGTLIVDSLTDIWKWVQEWGKARLAKIGKVNRETMAIKNQFDWGIMNGKNARLMTLFKHVTKNGLNFVGTARETNIPDYVATKQTQLPTEKIRCQKDVPFDFGSLLNLRVQRMKTPTGFTVKYLADVIRLDTLEYNKAPIENINYNKIKELMTKLEEEMKTKGGEKK